MLDILHLEHASYLGIIVVLILTGSGLPVPEEVPIIAAGVAANITESIRSSKIFACAGSSRLNWTCNAPAASSPCRSESVGSLNCYTVLWGRMRAVTNFQ